MRDYRWDLGSYRWEIGSSVALFAIAILFAIPDAWQARTGALIFFAWGVLRLPWEARR